MSPAPASRRAVLRAVSGAALGAALGAATLVALADPPKGGYPPDPPQRASQQQVDFDVVVESGKARVTSARVKTVQRADPTPRAMGRFALELYVGRELLDRLRFNVPLTGDDRDPAGLDGGKKRPGAAPPFTNVRAKLRVRMAEAPRAAWGQLVDRATGDTQRFWWPPEPDGRLAPMVADGAAPDSGRSDGGTADGGRPGDAGSDAMPVPLPGDGGATSDAH